MKLRQILSEIDGYQQMSDKTQEDLDRLFKKLSPAQKHNPQLLHSFLRDYFEGEAIGDAHDWAAKAAAVKNGIDPRVVSDIVYQIYKSAQGK